jgi:hypothetical protein
MGGKQTLGAIALPTMIRLLIVFFLACSACAMKPPASTVATDISLIVSAHGDECLVDLGNERLVTQRLESSTLVRRLRQLRDHTFVLQFAADTPYRCVGAVIVTLQYANVKFRNPQNLIE